MRTGWWSHYGNRIDSGSQKEPISPLEVQPRLSEAELGKVVKQLRSQFPLVSIRDRLQFQDREPAQSNFTISGPFAISGRHSVALASLHSDRVDSFISESGQGIFRITPVGPQDLFLPSGGLATKAKAQPVGSEIRFEAIVKLDETIKMQESRFRSRMGEMDPDDNFTNSLSADGLPKQQKLSIFNEWAVDSFASQAGYVKSIDEVAGFEAHRVRFGEHWSGNLRDSKEVLEQQDIDVEDSGIAWKANRLELVSLLMHDEPLVYDVDELPNMETLSSETAKTRALDEFETKALEALKSGEELFVRATKNRILMVGSIRASEQAGDRAAILTSLVASCKNNFVEPWAYLKDVLTKLPSHTSDQELYAMLPDQWLLMNPDKRWEIAPQRKNERQM